MIKFALTRHQYDSYTDYRMLVAHSGYSTCYVDEMDLQDHTTTYIVTPLNGEYKALIDAAVTRTNPLLAKVLIWELERPEDKTLQDWIISQSSIVSDGYATGILCSDRWLAANSGWTYVPVGLSPELGTPGHYDEKCYDVIHLMCPAHRRRRYFGPNWSYVSVVNGMTIAPSGWGGDRDLALKRSRFMLNIHKDEHRIIEPLRFTLAAAYGLPIITEMVMDAYPYNECEGMYCQLPYPNAPVERVIDRGPDPYKQGYDFRQAMLDNFLFTKCLERVL